MINGRIILTLFGAYAWVITGSLAALASVAPAVIIISLLTSSTLFLTAGIQIGKRYQPS